MRLILWIAAFLAACCVPARADLVELIPRIKPSIVAVGTEEPTRAPRHVFHGTGFAVGDGTMVLTNAHVVLRTFDPGRNQNLVVLADAAGRPGLRRARVLRTDMEHDLLLLGIDGPPLPALALAEDGAVREGMEVAFTGFPLGMALGLLPVTHRGIISAITPVATRMGSARDLNPQAIERLKKPFHVYQLDATAYPGNSGSPLYDPVTGRVLGVLNSVFIKQSKEAAIRDPSGISYAIPVEFVRGLLAAGP